MSFSYGIPLLTSGQPAFEEPTVAPEPMDDLFGDEDAEWEVDDQPAPAVAPAVAPPSRKNRKSDKPLTAAQTERNRLHELALANMERHRADTRLPNEIYGTMGPVTEESHPRTHMVDFRDPGLIMEADYMGVRGFRNCLEHHIECVSPGKQRSFHRTADTLRRIVEKNPIPPMHYPRDDATTCTNWRHEIGCPIEGKSIESDTWEIRQGRVHRISKKKSKTGTTVKTKVVENLPEEPTEEWYAILTAHHHTHGHYGRDAVFSRISANTTTSISKDLVSDFVFQCCNVGLAARRKKYPDQAAAAKQELAREGKSSKGKKRAAVDDGDSIGIPPPFPAAKKPRIGNDNGNNIATATAGGRFESPYDSGFCSFTSPTLLAMAFASNPNQVGASIAGRDRLINFDPNADNASPEIASDGSQAVGFDENLGKMLLDYLEPVPQSSMGYSVDENMNSHAEVQYAVEEPEPSANGGNAVDETPDSLPAEGSELPADLYYPVNEDMDSHPWLQFGFGGPEPSADFNGTVDGTSDSLPFEELEPFGPFDFSNATESFSEQLSASELDFVFGDFIGL